MHETEHDYYIELLDRFATNGHELLSILNAIEEGVISCHVGEEDLF